MCLPYCKINPQLKDRYPLFTMFLFFIALSERLFSPQKSCPAVLPSNLYIVCSIPPVHNLNVPGSTESLAYKDKWAPDK